MSHPIDLFKFCPKCGSNDFFISSPISKKCDACGFEFFKNPAIGVGGLIFDEQDRLLAIRRAKDPAKGTLAFVGGFVDIGETLEQALIREAKEELGLDITPQKMIASFPNNYIYQDMDQYPLDFFFLCKVQNTSNFNVQQSEISEVLWIEKDKINIEDFGLPSNRSVLKKFLDIESGNIL